jgi:endonuclease/exonuclease/phosphatase (EEP) superfamily protein YafD
MLFLYRALAPVLFAVSAIAFTFALLIAWWRGKELTTRRIALWCLLLSVTLAPIIRSLEFIPTYILRPPERSPSVTILNINALGFRDLSAGIISEITARDPDVVTIQEVNPPLAEALSKRFSASYRCIVLKPAEGSWGMGTLAKSPCTERLLPSHTNWIGPPLIVETNTSSGAPITVANFHAIHPHAAVQNPYPQLETKTELSLWRRLSQPIADRQLAFKTLLAELGDATGRNIIMTGDLNASMRNGIYALIRASGFRDTWLDLHPVFSGGTWPAPEFLGGVGIGWLLRIDFMFRSEALLPVEIDLLSEKLGSDHRGIFGRFAVG